MTGEIIAIALGLLVGLSLGALGGGGSTLAVPILVFVGGLQAQDATSASLLVVGIASAIGVYGHFRKGNVRLGTGIAFGAAGIVGSRLGTTVNQSINENVLLLAFSALILFVAIRMYRSINAKGSAPVFDPPAAGPASHDVTTAADVAHSTRTAELPRHGLDLSAPALAKLAGAATAVGILTGLFGVGGGFAVVPALTLLLGFKAKEAIGTSLVVIAINAAIALALRWGDLHFDWSLELPFLTTVTIGVLVGSAIAHRIAAESLTRSFSIMLGVVAFYTAISTILS